MKWSFDARRLWELLDDRPPARRRGGRLLEERPPRAGRGDRRSGRRLEEISRKLYDDQFVETCAEWVAPYIGDLVGYRTLYGLTDRIGQPRRAEWPTRSPTAAARGASMLEQLART